MFRCPPPPLDLAQASKDHQQVRLFVLLCSYCAVALMLILTYSNNTIIPMMVQATDLSNIVALLSNLVQSQEKCDEEQVRALNAFFLRNF